MPVALLPIRLQREYGVTAASADLQMQAALDLQSRWQSRAASCVFSWAAAAEGIVAAPSPLLPAAPLLNESQSTPQSQPHWRALLRAAPLLERFLDETAPRFLPDVERTRGVSTLRDQSRCAFRGFAGTRLQSSRWNCRCPVSTPANAVIWCITHSSMCGENCTIPAPWHRLHPTPCKACWRKLRDAPSKRCADVATPATAGASRTATAADSVDKMVGGGSAASSIPSRAHRTSRGDCDLCGLAISDPNRSGRFAAEGWRAYSD